MDATFSENPTGQLVTKSQKMLTDSTYNMGKVKHTSLSSELTLGEKKEKIDLISFVEKEPKLGLWKAPKERVEDWRSRFGNQSVENGINRGEAQEILFQREEDNILLLNQKGNQNVPKIVEHRPNYYKMQFIRGISGEKAEQTKPSRETKILITKQTLNAVRDVFKDGVVNMEYAPKNSIIIPNLKTGAPEKVILIDFGVSFQIDPNGKIEVDMDLFNKSGVRIDRDYDGVGLFPPELTGKTGKVKIDAEKALVWSLTHRVMGGWLLHEKIPGIRDFAKKAVSTNPEERWTLDEFISFFENIEIDSSKIGSCVPDDVLKANQQMLGRPDSEVAVSEKEVERILGELEKLKNTPKP